jgi:hypothetical protein
VTCRPETVAYPPNKLPFGQFLGGALATAAYGTQRQIFRCAETLGICRVY